jgi:type IV secretion system protein TrbL
MSNGCAPACGHHRVEAIDLNPMHWLGSAAGKAVGDVWTSAMTGLWSAALWLLKLAFRIIDAFTTPDLSANGPMGSIAPTTLWIGGTVAVIMMFVQLTLALVRRDGQSLGRVLHGVGQFGLVWLGYLGVGAGLVAAASGLEHGILQSMLHVNSLSGIDLSQDWPDKIDDITLATVLGVLSLLIVIPAAFFYVLIMFVREAALIILIATAPIAAGGLTSDTGKVWFWKTLRWFFACLLIAPCTALLLGVGVQLSNGVISQPASKDQVTAQHTGMAVVGCLVIAIGACCPLVLFRLLSFVDPGTASGAALRQSWADAGGMAGLAGGSRGGNGSSAATQSGSDGRSAGESNAESQTQSRLAGALGLVGTGMQLTMSVAQRAADVGSDTLGQAGVGSPGYSMSPTDERVYHRGGGSGGANGGTPPAGDTAPSGGDGGAPPAAPMPPDAPTPPPPTPKSRGGGPGGPGPAGPPSGGGGAGAGGAEAAAAVAV